MQLKHLKNFLLPFVKALAEIIFPNTIQNIYSPLNVLYLESEQEQYKVYIPEDYYETEKQLCETILKTLREVGFKSTLKHDSNTKKYKFIMSENERIHLHPKLANIFGFIEQTSFRYKTSPRGRPEVYHADISADVSLVTYALFIYCDVIESSKIGSIEAPILGILHCEFDKKQKYTQRVVPVLNFVPLLDSVISKVEIKVLDTTGSTIHFKNGKLVLKLIIIEPNEEKY